MVGVRLSKGLRLGIGIIFGKDNHFVSEHQTEGHF